MCCFEQGIYACAVEAAKKFPLAKIILYGTLPKGLKPDDPDRLTHNKMHTKLATMPMPTNVKYRNLTSEFTHSDGTLKRELYNSDYLHLNGDGYNFWVPIIAGE